MAPKVSSTKIKKSKFLKPRISKDPVCKDWLTYINNETSKAVIPVGLRYQADVPDWSGQILKDNSVDSKWLGTKIWQSKNATPTTLEEDDTIIGKGRPNFCLCSFSGSAECVKLHVSDKIIQMMSDLGPAYRKWGFHEMGDAVGDSWNVSEQKMFHSLVTMRNVRSKRTSFLDLVLEHLPSKCRESVVSYYFNVYVSRRISLKIRSGTLEVDVRSLILHVEKGAVTLFLPFITQQMSAPTYTIIWKDECLLSP